MLRMPMMESGRSTEQISATAATKVEVELTTTEASSSTKDDNSSTEPAPPPQEDDGLENLEEGVVHSDSDDSTDDEGDANEGTSLRTLTRRDELLADASDNQNLISRLFPRDPKAIGTRRYLMVIFASAVVVGFLSFLFTMYYLVSVQPIQELSDTVKYQKRTCTVLDQNLFHDVTVGLGSTWRGELRVAYNLTKNVNSRMVANVHELVTGQLGFQSTAIEFLRRPDHQVGATFSCLVDVANMPYYAVPVAPAQIVAGSVIASMTFIMLFNLFFAYLMFRSMYNFYVFIRYYSWSAENSVWSVEGHGKNRQEMLPP